MYDEEPDCSKCLPEMCPENVKVYEVYYRMFGPIEKPDIFKIMGLVGIENEEQLYCFDLINSARSEVLKSREVKS